MCRRGRGPRASHRSRSLACPSLAGRESVRGVALALTFPCPRSFFASCEEDGEAGFGGRAVGRLAVGAYRCFSPPWGWSRRRRWRRCHAACRIGVLPLPPTPYSRGGDGGQGGHWFGRVGHPAGGACCVAALLHPCRGDDGGRGSSPIELSDTVVFACHVYPAGGASSLPLEGKAWRAGGGRESAPYGWSGDNYWSHAS